MKAAAHYQPQHHHHHHHHHGGHHNHQHHHERGAAGGGAEGAHAHRRASSTAAGGGSSAATGTASGSSGSSGQRKHEIVEERRRRENGQVVVTRYLKGKFLGKGGFAKCYVATDARTKLHYALKVVPLSALEKSRAKQKFRAEIRIHSNLRHDHVVGFERYFEDRTNAYILLELCHNNSMAELIKRRKRLTEPEVRYYMLQLVEAFKYLHRNFIIHRDLKLGNLFIDRHMQIKVGDFGLAAQLSNANERKRTICGTPNYIAPEILESDCGHSFQVDIWSMGVVLYTLISGRPPYEASDVKATYRRILQNSYTFPDYMSQNARRLVRRMLQTHADRRPNLDAIHSHPFFTARESYVPRRLPHSALHHKPSLADLQAASAAGSPTRSSSSSSSSRPSGGTTDATQAQENAGTTTQAHAPGGSRPSRAASAPRASKLAQQQQPQGGPNDENDPGLANRHAHHHHNAHHHVALKTRASSSGLATTATSSATGVATTASTAATRPQSSSRGTSRPALRSTAPSSHGGLKQQSQQPLPQAQSLQTQSQTQQNQGWANRMPLRTRSQTQAAAAAATTADQAEQPMEVVPEEATPTFSTVRSGATAATGPSTATTAAVEAECVQSAPNTGCTMSGTETAIGKENKSPQDSNINGEARVETQLVPRASPAEATHSALLGSGGITTTASASVSATATTSTSTATKTSATAAPALLSAESTKTRSASAMSVAASATKGDTAGSVGTEAMSSTYATPDGNRFRTTRQVDLGTLENMHRKLHAGNSTPISPTDMENLRPRVWVTRHVDYSSKYGLGFLLNNGSAGVYFNDSTKIVLEPEGEVFQYVERRRTTMSGANGDGRRVCEHISHVHSLSSYPPDLKKKVTLLKHFRHYLLEQEQQDGRSTTAGAESASGRLSGEMAVEGVQNEEAAVMQHTRTPNLVYLKKWVKTRHAILFRLSNHTVQVTFLDRSEVLLSSEARLVTYVNKQGERSVHTLEQVMRLGRNDIAKRLKYTKDLLHQLIAGQSTVTASAASSLPSASGDNDTRRSSQGSMPAKRKSSSSTGQNLLADMETADTMATTVTRTGAASAPAAVAAAAPAAAAAAAAVAAVAAPPAPAAEARWANPGRQFQR